MAPRLFLEDLSCRLANDFSKHQFAELLTLQKQQAHQNRAAVPAAASSSMGSGTNYLPPPGNASNDTFPREETVKRLQILVHDAIARFPASHEESDQPI